MADRGGDDGADGSRLPDFDTSQDQARPVRPRHRKAATISLAVVILAAAGIAAAASCWARGDPRTFVATQPGQPATSVAFSPSGTLLAGGDVNGHVYLWNIATGRQVANLATGGADVYLGRLQPGRHDAGRRRQGR